MSEKEQGIYEFHNFQLDIGKGVLLRENQPVNLQWKTFELLCTLVKSNGNLITRDELMNELWAETFVEDNNLSQHIRLLRKVLGDGENGAIFIETVPRRGYRFLPDVRIVNPVDEMETVSIGAIRNQIAAAEDILDTSDFEHLTDIQPTTVSHVSDNKNEAKIIAFPAPENSFKTISKSETAGKDPFQAKYALKQNTHNQPKITKRRRGFRRGLKSLLWGLGIGFGFLILLQILQISSMVIYGTNKLHPELADRLGTFIATIAIPVGLGYAFGIGLFLFGIFRLIYAIFEKENSKLNSSLIEKLLALMVTGIIAAIAIPNLIASYRSAQEYQQSQMNKKSQSQIKSIAVLPLKSLSSNADDEELRLRITDALITNLGGLKDIATRPTDSIMRFSKSELSSLEIGKKLQVDAVLDGRIQREDERVRITVQLISVPAGEQIWSEQFDGEVNKILILQDTISAKLLQTLNQKRQQTIQFAARPTQNAEAFEAYLKARFLARRSDAKSLLKAIDYYRQAVKFDPQFAESYAGMADVQFRIYITGNERNPETVAQAKENIQTAVNLNPNSAFILTVLAYSQMFIDWDWENAEKTIKRAIDIEPNIFAPRFRYGMLLTTLRRYEEAQTELEQAIKLDPTNANAVTNLGLLYFCKKDFVRAEAEFRKALELDEKSINALWYMSRCLWMQEKKEESNKYLVQALNAEGDEKLARKIEEKAKTSNPDDVIRLLINEWSTDPKNKDYISLANRTISIGEREEALSWLEKSLEERHPKTIMIASLPDFEPLRNEPRFQAILQKMNLN